MIHKIYTIYDSKAEAYNQPFYSRTHGEAIRSFEAACSNPESNFARHAEDYTLFHLGEFDDNNGLAQWNMTPVPLAKANEVLARQASAA